MNCPVPFWRKYEKKITVMTKMERIAAAIRGDAVDTVPYSLWSHLPLIDLDPVKMRSRPTVFIKRTM